MQGKIQKSTAQGRNENEINMSMFDDFTVSEEYPCFCLDPPGNHEFSLLLPQQTKSENK